MSMSDPIADMLTRIRNGQTANRASVQMPASKKKLAIAKVLKDEPINLNETEIQKMYQEAENLLWRCRVPARRRVYNRVNPECYPGRNKGRQCIQVLLHIFH